MEFQIRNDELDYKNTNEIDYELKFIFYVPEKTERLNVSNLPIGLEFRLVIPNPI